MKTEGTGNRNTQELTMKGGHLGWPKCRLWVSNSESEGRKGKLRKTIGEVNVIQAQVLTGLCSRDIPI
jgi:hypothetical protein